MEVSVIIPCYNVEKFILKCLESLNTQTFRDFEIIVVDDGSTDNSELVIKKYLNENCLNYKYLKQKNSGPSKARNTGITNSSGKYIALLDSDDSFTKDSLEKKISAAKKNDNIDFIYSDAFINYENGMETKRREKNFKEVYHGFHSGIIFENLIDKNFIPTTTVFCKKYLFEKFGFFNENIIVAEDYDLWLRFAVNKCNFFYIDECLSYYSVRSTSLSGDQIRMNLQLIEILKSLYAFNISKNIERKISERIGNIYFINTVLEIFHLINNEAFKAVYRKMFTLIRIKFFHPVYYIMFLLLIFSKKKFRAFFYKKFKNYRRFSIK
ncbi:MAG: glycosyltransferase [Bacteroidetes bacterium]|nr:glycosyltransferase [Bacteroidota bacterium]